MDSGLNRNAAIFTNDIYPTLCRLFGRAAMQGKSLMRLGQVFSAVFGVFIVSIATYFANTEGRGVFEHMLNIGALLALPMAVPTLLGLFIRTSPSWAAIVTVCVTLIPSAIGFFSAELFGETWSFQQKVFINLTVGVVAYLLTVPFLESRTGIV